MNIKRALVMGLPLIASCLLFGLRRELPQSPEDRIGSIAEIEIYPEHLDAYKAALKEASPRPSERSPAG